MSGTNLFGDYTDENAGPEIIDDPPSVFNFDQNVKANCSQQMIQIQSENYQLIQDREKHYKLIIKLEEEISKYQKELEESLEEFNKNNLMLEECDQKIQNIDNQIDATSSSREGIKTCSEYAYKLLQFLKVEKADDYQNFIKLKEIYYIYIENINDIIKEIKDEQFQIENENHIANQNAIILQLDKQYLEIETQIKKLKEENEQYEKNYK